MRPELDIDLYSDSAILDPYPSYRTIRDQGAAVWLPRHDVWAIGRFHDLRAALRADAVLLSGHGVSLNSFVNDQPARVTLTTDGELHRRLRTVLMKPMMPSALREVASEVQDLADSLVARLLAVGSFDGIADFATHLPVSIVSKLVGLPEEGRQRMLEWAAAIFNVLGPMNERTQAALPVSLEMVDYASRIERSSLRSDGWGARLFAAADDGKIDPADVRGLLIDYIAPSLDTTLLGTGNLLFQLGSNSQQWSLLKNDRALIPRAVDEALRLDAPVRAFTRLALADYDVAGTTIPAGDRVLVIYGSGNRDERRFTDPDRFEITRDARDHLGFGHGVHRCAGGYLAELEMQALLHALVEQVTSIEVGEPEVFMNNVLRGYQSLPARFR